MQNGDLFSEMGRKSRKHLGRKRNLGNKQDRALPRLQYIVDQADINARLPASRNAEKQGGCSTAAESKFLQAEICFFLRVVQGGKRQRTGTFDLGAAIDLSPAQNDRAAFFERVERRTFCPCVEKHVTHGKRAETAKKLQ